jgi:hypothetical protein
MSKEAPSRYTLLHERKGRLSRLVLLDRERPVAASSRLPTEEVAQWMRRYDIPFTGLLRTGWNPTGDQWAAICRKWFPEVDGEGLGIMDAVGHRDASGADSRAPAPRENAPGADASGD